MALISRAYIDRYGGSEIPGEVFHTGYHHNFCDTEFFWMALRRQRHAYCATSIVEHMHPAAGKASLDKTYAKGLSTFEEDQAHFQVRVRTLCR
jgi:hypothetical protein